MFSSQLKVQQSLPRQRMLETHYRVPVVNHSHVWPSILSLNWSINLTPKTELQSDYPKTAAVKRLRRVMLCISTVVLLCEQTPKLL